MAVLPPAERPLDDLLDDEPSPWRDAGVVDDEDELEELAVVAGGGVV